MGTHTAGLWSGMIAGALVAALAAACGAQEFKLNASSFLGGAGDDDSVVGARILSDGTIVLAANVAPDYAPPGVKVGGAAAGRGCLFRLSQDGKRVVAARRVADDVKDMAADDKDALYVAAGAAGVLKVDGLIEKVVWTAPLPGSCDRVDAARDGRACAAITNEKAGARVHVLGRDGKALGTAPGRGFTNDVCVDGASQTVVFTGFRNAKAFDGKKREPVQIAYLQAIGYDAKRKWTAYDWDTDEKSDRFINKPTNNMADTRGYRCAVGRDGKLYAAFEAAGGNHIFRYSPTDISEKVKLVGGDAYHQFHASAAEHKTTVCRFDPATGKFEGGQQWCARKPNGKANNARMKDGDVAADEAGRVYLTGYVGDGIPLRPDPLPEGQARAGAYLLVLSPDLKTRLFCTRTAPDAGWAHCVDARTVGGSPHVVYGGGAVAQGMYTLDPVQKDPAGKDGFFVVVGRQ